MREINFYANSNIWKMFQENEFEQAINLLKNEKQSSFTAQIETFLKINVLIDQKQNYDLAKREIIKLKNSPFLLICHLGSQRR